MKKINDREQHTPITAYKRKQKNAKEIQGSDN